MYYYLLEGRQQKNGRRFEDRLADQLTDTGIAGEMVMQSALKTIDDLLHIGVSKGYSTVVAVGSDRHIHRVISGLMSRPRDERPVLGVIATDSDSLVARLINAPTIPAMLQALKLRRLVHASLAEIEQKHYILTQATLALPRPMTVRARIDDAEIETFADSVVISGDGQLDIHSALAAGRRFTRGLAWLIGASIPQHDTSLFHGQIIELSTEIPLPLTGQGETLTHTPCTIRTVRRALKLIVTRATISGATENPHEGADNS